ncbi:hypothetical protein FHU36_003771 [Nonomuraea muscovyensis]|uniref:Mobilization protein n=1 Tax=Nonomuraea muscovyensis TaxID=1124761 RepID=A0A7X0F006_9ACTN|nr:hypothetical protein [Nonomuraea muscovyensis]MBB6347226.1 hypothetical protein [Nonomuraea muscovyensis]
MIAMVHPGPGSRTRELLRELYGPSTSRYEHQRDPHLIAAWDPFEPDPATGEATLDDLAAHLNRPVDVSPYPLRRHVWHCTVLTARHDRVLTDTTWAQIAARLLDAAGIAPFGDLFACRWIALRHARDHIHLIATLARQDGRRPNLHGNWYRMRDTCDLIEAQLGLGAV